MPDQVTDFTCAPIINGQENGIARFAPSPIIRSGGEYYVWYTRKSIRGGKADASIYYATSHEGKDWVEQGKALKASNGKDWDSGEVFNPTIMIANHFYWLFYIGKKDGPLDLDEAPTGLGIAFSESPRGPWEKLVMNPIMHPSHSNDVDCYRIDSACMMNRNSQYWMYYRCREYGDTGGRLELAVAEYPEGPYDTVPDTPSLSDVQSFALWPHGPGIAALVTHGSGESALYVSEDGVQFTRRQELDAPLAPAPFREDAYAFTPFGRGVSWGICEAREGPTRYLQRFDCNLRFDGFA